MIEIRRYGLAVEAHRIQRAVHVVDEQPARAGLVAHQHRPCRIAVHVGQRRELDEVHLDGAFVRRNRIRERIARAVRPERRRTLTSARRCGSRRRGAAPLLRRRLREPDDTATTAPPRLQDPSSRLNDLVEVADAAFEHRHDLAKDVLLERVGRLVRLVSVFVDVLLVEQQLAAGLRATGSPCTACSPVPRARAGSSS